MKPARLLQIIGATSLFLFAASPGVANIFVDENFEGTTPFTNRNYPIQDNTTPPSASTIAATQGINIRAQDAGAAAAPIISVSTTGAISTAAAFTGTKSLQLTSGQIAASANNAYHNFDLNWMPTMQFAIAVSPGTLSLPNGTQVGHFTQNWATSLATSMTLPADYSLQINLVRNATGGVDLVTSGTNIGTLTANQRWAMVTVIANKDLYSATPPTQNWECYDPLTYTYKGPQPTAGDPGNGSGTYATLGPGIHIFVNGNTEDVIFTPTQIGHNWADDPTVTATDSKANHTYLINWEVGADGGGTVYVDDMFWSAGLFQTGKGADPETRDAAARMSLFMPVVPATAAQDWQLYRE